MTDDVDDSLLCAWEDGAPAQGALSVSSAKDILEDSHKWFLKKVERRNEPPTVPLVRGSAHHDGLEALCRGEGVRAGLLAYKATLDKGWPKIEDPRIRINPTDPSQPAGKQLVDVDVEAIAREDGMRLRWIMRMLESGWDRYTQIQAISAAIQNQTAMAERELGEAARDRGMPWAMARAWDYDVDGWVEKPAAVVGGVLLQGRVDLEAPWADGSDYINDWKAVGSVIPFWGYRRTPFEPSYDAATDLQLDAYAAATGVERLGFTYILKQPQYVPSGGLHPRWVDEPAWQSKERPYNTAGELLLPMASSVDSEGDLRYVSIWRPGPGDHPGIDPDHYPFYHRDVYPVAAMKLRAAAETLTESLVLLIEGAEPEVAFLPGDPGEIGRKSCPWCPFRPDGSVGGCRAPMELPAKNREAAHREALARRTQLHNERERALAGSREIARLRDHWRGNPHSPSRAHL